jgi:hypothetical protein
MNMGIRQTMFSAGIAASNARSVSACAWPLPEIDTSTCFSAANARNVGSLAIRGWFRFTTLT